VNNTRAYRVYLIREAANSFIDSMMFVILTVYYVKAVGLNPLQLVLVGTAVELSSFIFEIPTGVVADTYSRKWSVILGQFLFGVCFIIEGLVPAFAALLIAEFIRGLGWTFISGAADAWLADEIGEQNVGRAYLRGSQVRQVTGFIGMATGVVLASVELSLPIVIGGALMMVIAGFLVLIMPEIGFKPTPKGERSNWQQMGNTLGDGVKLVRGRTLLMLIIAISFVYGGFSEGFDRLWEAHFLINIHFPPLGSGGETLLLFGFLKLNTVLVWFGIIAAGSTVLGMIATEIVRRRVDTNNHRVVALILLVCNAVLIVGVVCFGLAGNFLLAVVAIWATDVVRTIAGPLTTTWLTQNTNSRVRATVLSMESQANAFGQMTCGPVVGFIGTITSLRVALTISGLILTPVLLLYTRTLRHGKQAEVVADDASASVDEALAEPVG
jgi:MFS transporter, DHA3 family, tetracycline resistance protein